MTTEEEEKSETDKVEVKKEAEEEETEAKDDNAVTKGGDDDTTKEETKKDDVEMKDASDDKEKKDDETNKVASEETSSSAKDDNAKDDKKEDDNDDNPVVQAVAERLRFFFSNANIRQDNFLRKYLMQEEDGTYPIMKDIDYNPAHHEPGFVSIEVLLRFNTIKKHTTDPAIVVKAAKSVSDLLSLNDKETAVQRVETFKRSQMDDNIPVTLMLKNVPLTEKNGNKMRRYVHSVDDIKKLFDPKYGTVALVRLRFGLRSDDDDNNNNNNQRKQRVPLGSALVEFDSKDGFDKAFADVIATGEGEEPKVKLTLGENTLEITTLEEFIKNKPKKGDKDNDKKAEDDKEEEKEEELYTFDWKPKCVIRLKGLTDTCSRESILECIAAFYGDDYGKDKETGKYKMNLQADFSRGDKDGAIRFLEPNDKIEEFAAKLQSGDATIDNAKVESVYLLEGDEEKEYWNKYIEFKRKSIKHRNEERNNSKNRRGQKRGGRGGGGRGRGNKRFRRN